MNLSVTSSETSAMLTLDIASPVDVADVDGKVFNTKMFEINFDSDGEVWIKGRRTGDGFPRLAPDSAVEVLNTLGYPAKVRGRYVYLTNKLRLF